MFARSNVAIGFCVGKMCLCTVQSLHLCYSNGDFSTLISCFNPDMALECVYQESPVSSSCKQFSYHLFSALSINVDRPMAGQKSGAGCVLVRGRRAHVLEEGGYGVMRRGSEEPD